MNYLAHAFLSYDEPLILVGNMISDFVKGGQKSGYTAMVQNGIMLHRAIDSFTDNHPATAKAKEIFRPIYRLYSGPIMDVVYDHFLANDASLFPGDALHPFTQRVYHTLEQETTHLPPIFLTVLTYMKTENWLYHYRTTAGIEKTLRGLVRRARYIDDSEPAYRLFLLHYEELQACYDAFFPDVKQMAKEELDRVLTHF